MGGSEMAYHSGTAGVIGWCCVAPAILWYSWIHFPLLLAVTIRYSIFRKFELEHTFRSHERKVQEMSAVDKLISYIKSITPEQADKIIRQMPRLIASAEEPCQPVPQKAS